MQNHKTEPATHAAKGTILPLRHKLAYGVGAGAFGIKDLGFSVFLLIYFNQVIGMPANMVGLAIMIALIADAFFDPVVGYLSDRTRSPWGRRHPWLYAAIIPIFFSWLFLWNPPDASSDMMMFLYLLFASIAVRFSLSVFEVPNLAMLPELSRDYHDRTSTIRFRFLFGWLSGLGMLFLAYAVFLNSPEGKSNGMLSREGYSDLALCGAIIMALCCLVSAIGTHKRLLQNHIDTKGQDNHIHGLADIWSTLSFEPFLKLMLAGLFAFSLQGVVFALSNYLLVFVWEFSDKILQLYPLSLLSGVVLAFILTPWLSRRLDKARAATLMALLCCISIISPYGLRLLGLFPENGLLVTIIMVLIFKAVATSFMIGVIILTSSMMADVTDASTAQSGKRSEGLFYSGFMFMQKSVGGIGIFLSGQMISAIGLPKGARPEDVDPAIIEHLSLSYIFAVAFTGAIAAFFYRRIQVSLAEHEANLARLASTPGESNG